MFGRRKKQGVSGGSDKLWTLSQGEIDGHPVLVRSKHVQPDESRPVKVTVKIGLADPRPDGWPGAGDRDVLATAEETLAAELASNGAELVLIATANFAREFIAYGTSHEWLKQWGPSVLDRWGDGRPGTGVNAEIEPGWETFRAFVQSGR